MQQRGRKNRVLLIGCLLIAISGLKAQDIIKIRTVEVRAGRTLVPGDYFSVRHERYMSLFINFVVNAYMENSNKNGLKYQAYGMDFLADYYTNIGKLNNHVFEVKVGLGISGMVVQEPYVYKDWPTSKRINYGLIGEIAGEWAMTEDFSLTLSGQQKYLFNQTLGSTKFGVNIGFKYKIYK